MAWSKEAIEESAYAIYAQWRWGEGADNEGQLKLRRRVWGEDVPDETVFDRSYPPDPKIIELGKDHYRAVAAAALDAASAVDGNPVDVRTVTAYECGFEAGREAERQRLADRAAGVNLLGRDG